MTNLSTGLRTKAMALAAAFIVQGIGHGQQQPAPPRHGPFDAVPPPTVLSLDTFGLVVANLDASVAFYRDAIGLEVLTPPSSAEMNPALNALTHTPGAKLRYARLRLPNEPYALELDEYSAIDRHAVQANHNDPGSSFMNFGVWDGTAAFETLRRAKPLVISAAGIPTATQSGHMAAVWIRDPDAHLIEFMQGGWDPQIKSLQGIRNVYRAHFGMTMEHYQQALQFYRDLLGFDISAGFPPMVAAGEYMSSERLAPMVGVPPQARMTGVAGHCAGARCEMFEFKDAPRVEFSPRLQDPGAAYLSMWVSDLDALLAKAKANGAEIITAGGVPVTLDSRELTLVGGYDTNPPQQVHSSRQIMIRDPCGFPVLLKQRIN